MPIPTIVDARKQLQLDDDDSSRDFEAAGFLSDAIGWVETYTGHILHARNVTEQFRGFSPVKLRAWPIAPDAPVGVVYQDENGTPIAVAGARLDVSARPARVLPPSGPFFTFRNRDQLFTVTVRAGYEDADPVPGNFRRAILVLISAYDADREGGDVLAKAEATARRLCYHARNHRL